MRNICFWLLIFVVMPISVSSQSAHSHLPPGAVQAGNTVKGESNSVEPPVEMRNRQINLQQVKQEAEDLRTLANALPAQIDQVANNQLPKDLSDNLKKIERLAKHLRSEVTP